MELEAHSPCLQVTASGWVLGLQMVVMCSWGAWHTAVQSLLSSVDRTASAQRWSSGQQLHDFRNNCIIADTPQPLLGCTEDTLGTMVDITV